MENALVVIIFLIILVLTAAASLLSLEIWKRWKGGKKKSADSNAGKTAAVGDRSEKKLDGASLEEGEPAVAPAAKRVRSSGPTGGTASQLLLKLGLISVLTLLMMIPLYMIGGIVRERASRHRSVAEGLQVEWGRPQKLFGPLLIIPLTYSWTETELMPVVEYENGKEKVVHRQVRREKTSQSYAAATPDEFFVNGEAVTEKRKRGIYEALVFSASLELSGQFTVPDVEELEKLEPDKRLTKIDWDKARLIVGLSDASGIKRVGHFRVGDRDLEVVPGAGLAGRLRDGFSVEVDASRLRGRVPFSLEVALNGSDALTIAPLAGHNEIKLKSLWPHPSFVGQALPFRRLVSENGFEAEWQVDGLVHSYRRLELANEAKRIDDYSDYRGGLSNYEMFLVGVSFINPVDTYLLSDRAVKYGCLFIGLTFLMIFLCEASQKNGLADKTGKAADSYRLHPLQYGVVGLALSLFYLILLSLAEHLPFWLAYSAAASLIVLMVGAYSLTATGRNIRAKISGLVMAFLYGTLYLILIQEDYALLSGTALLTVALAALMFFTNRVNRPSESQEQKTDGEEA